MKVWAFIRDREPAAVAFVVQALLGVAVAWGFNLSAEQVAALVTVSAALFGFLTRQVVTPVAKVPPSNLPAPHPVEDVEDLVSPVTDVVAPTTRVVTGTFDDLAGEVLGRIPIIGRLLGRKT